MQRKPEADAHRILVRGVNWLGDAVMTTPALLRLRERFPAAHIALLTPAKLQDLWQRHDRTINETIAFAPGETIRSIRKKLKPKEFDLALVLPNSPRSALEVWFAGIPERVGYARPWRNLFLTNPVPHYPGRVRMQKRSVPEIQKLVAAGATARPAIPAGAHQIHEYLHLVGALGASTAPIAPRIQDDWIDQAAMSSTLGLRERLPDRVIGLNPGAEYGPAKRWPVENFAAVANELHRRLSCEFLIFGGKGDVEIGQKLKALLPIPASKGQVHLLAGKTDLRELMAGLLLCHALLTNDSGPMHVAAALGTAVVVPFGSTSPELTGPGLPGDTRHQLLKSDAPCSPCFLRECPIDFRCMKGISVERVVEAVMQIVR